MVSKKELARIRRFVCDELRDEPDLSTLTIGILKRRYMALVQCQSLNPEAKHFMKRVAQVELMKMQDNDKIKSEPETKKLQNKRKREKGVVMSSGEDKSTAKKSRYQSSSSSSDSNEADSDDKDDCNTQGEESEEEEQAKSGSEEEEQAKSGSEEEEQAKSGSEEEEQAKSGSEEEEQAKSGSEEEEQEMKKTQGKTKVNVKHQMNSEDSTDEELNESGKDGEASGCGDGPEEMGHNGASTTKSGETGSSNMRQRKKNKQSDEENDDDTDNTSERSEQNNDNSTSDSEMEQKVSVEKRLPLKERETKTKDNKKKNVKKEKSTGGQKNDKAVVRLKRYIALCGVRRNYKKLLDGCHSVRATVAVLKKELEDLGVHGHPSVQKCKTIRKKREEDQEIAELDVNNIIATEGRPRRRAAWKEQPEPRSPKYVCTLNSDSDEENNTHQGRQRAANWANLKGIISDDADSD